MERLTEEPTVHNDRALRTSVHEMGHAMVASALDGEVPVISVVPKGNCLGYTRVIFLRGSVEQRVNALMASLCGGWVAEEMVGVDNHRGCGKDMLMLDYYANVASVDIYGGRVSPEKIKSEAFSQARSLMRSKTLLLSRARHLHQNLVLV